MVLKMLLFYLPFALLANNNDPPQPPGTDIPGIEIIKIPFFKESYGKRIQEIKIFYKIRDAQIQRRSPTQWV